MPAAWLISQCSWRLARRQPSAALRASVGRPQLIGQYVGQTEDIRTVSVFKQDPAEWQRLDWRLLQNSLVTLYFSRAILDADVSWLDEHGYRVRTLRGGYDSADALLIALADLLAFPEYFGRNLDGFNDCLSDVEIPEEGGLVLVLHEFHLCAQKFRPVAQAILNICATNARRFLLTGRRFIVLVHSSDPRIAFEPVGATPVMWNPQEWLNAKRGI